MSKSKYLGEINLLGLSEFGGLNPLYGTLIGGGAAAITSMMVAKTASAANRDMFGLIAGLAVAGGMFMLPSTKKASVSAAIGAILVSGLRILDRKMTGSLGIPSVNYLNGLSIAQVQALNGPRRQADGTYLNGLGIPQIQAVSQSAGTIPGVHGPAFAGSRLGDANPVNLLGASTPQSQKITMMGGPPVHGLSASYGATLLGGGRS